MKKSVRIEVSIGLLLLFVLLLLFAKFLRLPFINIRLEEAMPTQTAFAIAFRNDMLEKPIDAEVFSSFVPNTLKNDLQNFQSLFSKQFKFNEQQRFLSVLQPSKSTGMDILFITGGARKLNLDRIFAKSSSYRAKKNSYRNHEIWDIKAGDIHFAVAKYRNILLFGRQAYLLESAISQLKTPSTSLYRNEYFTGVHQHHQNGSADWQFFVNLEQLSSKYASLIHPAQLSKVARLAGIGNWMKLQFKPEAKFSEWEGALSAAPTNKLLESNRRSLPIDYKKAFPFLPDNLSMVIWMTLKDYVPAVETETWKRNFKSWVGGEMALAMGEPLEGDSYERFLLLRSKQRPKSAVKFNDFLKKNGDAPSFDYQMFKVYRLNAAMIKEVFELREWTPELFAADLGDYVLFSNSQRGLERWLDKYIAGQTFAKSTSILKMLRTLPLESNGFLYLDSGNTWQQLTHYLEDGLEAGLPGNPMKFDQLALTWTRTGSICKFKAIHATSESNSGKPLSMLWRVPLSAPAIIAPAIIRNQESDESFVFIQDATYQVYFITKSGRVIWRRMLSGPILSEISTIDLNNNGELQMVFNTASQLFILDESGADMEGFPLQLKTPATNGVTVIDFFKSHDYRFFVACENGKAYGFDERGAPIEGWRPHDSIGIVKHPLVHFQAASMDFLTLLDESGNLQVYQKNGEFRFPAIMVGAGANQKPFFQADPVSSRIVVCDPSGRVTVCNLNGGTFGLSLKVGTNQNVRFAFADVTGDERKDYIAMSGQHLSVYTYQGSDFRRVFEYEFKMPQDEVFPIALQKGKKNYIGVVSKSSGQIHMLDGNGKMLPQFPLAGTTRFSIFDLLGDGRAALITANQEQVFAYSLN